MRYEYKMACFAEFRGEDEVALKYVTRTETCAMCITNDKQGTTRMHTRA